MLKEFIYDIELYFGIKNKIYLFFNLCENVVLIGKICFYYPDTI